MAESIKLSLTQSGDLLGIRPPLLLDSSQLSPTAQAHLEQLLQALREEKPLAAPGRAGSERREYALAVRRGEIQHSYRAVEGAVGAPLQALIDFVRAQHRDLA